MPSLTSMAEAILAQAKKIDAYLEAQGSSYPSFEEDTLDELPDKLQNERWALANSANELKQLVRGAEARVTDTAMSWTDVLALTVVYHYNLADAVPLDGSASYAQIAAASGLKEDFCRRFLRIAMSNYVFNEDQTTRHVLHTASSRRLVTETGLRDLLGLELEDIAPASSKLIEVWEKYGQDAAEPSRSAFSLHNESDKPAYAILASQPERARRFGGAMGFLTKGESWNLSHLLAAFDWATIDKPGAQIVDVGGGIGTVSKFLAQHTKDVRFVVQDLAHVISQMPPQPTHQLEHRVRFVEHDFFTPQHADSVPTAFVLRYILHNWSDQYVVKILNNLVPAMRRGSKVLIWEHVLEDLPVTDLTGRVGFQGDAIMATVFNGKERTAAEFKHLFKQADSRYVVDAVRCPQGSAMSMVEVGWTG
ncbi:hypothetical protein QQS21_008659 [Conoideocrella luteorostrata]|uniref:S-adenosyl-L-methionine-dependent methyltransferase n=1 Tax=Conoideocrella luteorostrata TaxID=1105319 RepID=A0AAJ0FYI1_9HYPO|nr:hypothetical protein QQS21_008659 [Conoideocrella luteorostrata]